MEHRPVAEEPVRAVAKEAQLHFDMPVIATDSVIGVADFRARAFEQLNVSVLSADQRASDIVAGVASARIEKDAIKRRLIIAERAR